jgi:hypothetical protein
MNDDRLRKLADDLAHQRDDAIRQALEAVTEGAREYHLGRAVAFRSALTCLWIFSNGQFGGPEPRQPNPFELVPILGGRRDR